MNHAEKYAPVDVEINDLWHLRPSLNEAQWSRLYTLVTRVLQQSHFREMTSLGETKEDYIQAFFVEKILGREPAAAQGVIHAGFIQRAFRNFLLDELRRPANRDRVHLDQQEDGQPDESTRIEQFYQLQHEKDGQEASGALSMEQTLAAYGLSIEQVHDSAWQWLQAQEKWAQLYLAVHFCPDPQDLPPSLQGLAARHAIASYHSRARQLGITNKKTDLPADYARTAIGRWAAGLGVGIAAENTAALLCLFKCLCLATLSLQGVFE